MKRALMTVKNALSVYRIVNVPLNGPAAKAAFGVAGLIAISAMLYFTCTGFVVSSLADRRVDVEPDVMAQATDFFPRSARLQWRLAEGQLAADEADLVGAESHAERAVELCPNRFQYRLTLAAAQEALGDRSAAESSIRAAVNLAPRDANVRWELANLLFRKGDLPESLEQFKAACIFDESLVAATLNLVWNPKLNNVADLAGIIPPDPASRLLLARFLAGQGRPNEAAAVFAQTGIPKTSPETAAFADLIFSDGSPALARLIWAGGPGSGSGGEPPIVWNGGFEQAISGETSRFNWLFGPTKYARIGIDDRAAHTGRRSLKIDFAGIDTTKLDGEISQTIVLEPSTEYHLSFYVKTDGLVSPEGPRVTVSISEADWQALSAPVASGSHDWALVALDFTTPAKAESGATPSSTGGRSAHAAREAMGPSPGGERSFPAVLSITRKPAFSYDDPTKGTVWYDDFTITEARTQQ